MNKSSSKRPTPRKRRGSTGLPLAAKRAPRGKAKPRGTRKPAQADIPVTADTCLVIESTFVEVPDGDFDQDGELHSLFGGDE